MLTTPFRCDADPTDLDGSPAELRTLEQLLMLVETVDEDTLWFDFGIVPNFMVCCGAPLPASERVVTTHASHILRNSRVRIYMNFSLQTSSTRQSRGRSKTTSLRGLRPTLNYSMVPLGGWRSLTRLIEGLLQLLTNRTVIPHPLSRIAIVPLFPGLRRFKQGRNFQQWTGNDSKAFMKVFVTSLEGFVPVDIIKCITAFLEVCYIARLDTITQSSLDALDQALHKFHHHRKIFQESGVRPTGFSLPRQHALIHYHHHIEKFGAPNGLSSSITESKHISAVKKPWRQSNHYEALGQMLTINSRNDKLAAARVDFSSRGMLNGTCLSEALEKLRNLPEEDTISSDGDTEDDLDDDGVERGRDLDADEEEEEPTGPVEGPAALSEVTLAHKRGKSASPLTSQTSLTDSTARGYPLTSFQELGRHIEQQNLEPLVRRFLFYQENPTSDGIPPLPACPSLERVENISVFHSAKAIFCAPSNNSGIEGFYRETIRSTPRWQTSGITAPRRDCVLLATGSDTAGVRGLDVARVHLFFSFVFRDEEFQCALVHEFCKSFTDPDPDNGLWIFEPDRNPDGHRIMSVIHLDSIIRAAHLLPVFGDDAPIPREINFTHTLDAFKAFYLNKYIDYHAFETLS